MNNEFNNLNNEVNNINGANSQNQTNQNNMTYQQVNSNDSNKKSVSPKKKDRNVALIMMAGIVAFYLLFRKSGIWISFLGTVLLVGAPGFAFGIWKLGIVIPWENAGFSGAASFTCAVCTG